jgi:hypothetical protein
MLFSVLLVAVVLRLQRTLALPQPDPTLANYTRAFSEAQILPDILASYVVYTDPATKQPFNVTTGVRLMKERECHSLSCPLMEAIE